MTEEMGYFTSSVGWSAIYFVLGYLACKAEIRFRKHRDDERKGRT